VAGHLRRLLPRPWQVTLLAVDGATAPRLTQQLHRLPADATHVAVAIGGNDALGNFDILSRPLSSAAEALDLFKSRVDAFEAAYRKALEAVVAKTGPVIVCTVYNGALPDPAEARRARTALTLFNDVIVRTALELGCVLLDLRLVCTASSDYANPIEPSGAGGEKIARALARLAGAIPGAEAAAYAPHRTSV
jgi:hypothetical protein